MVLTPAILALSLDAKGSSPQLADFLQNPYFGMFCLLFIGSLMASRLPTISLKSLHIQRHYMAPVMAGLLLIIALLVSNFWLTLGVVGFLYILTIPLTFFIFVRVRANYEHKLEG